METKVWNWKAPIFSPTLPLLPPSFPSLVKLHFPSTTTTTRLVAYNSVSDAEPLDNKKQILPTYSPTPPNRDLRTPHSGYHFDGTTRKFFEGWYFKVAIPERRQSFCFMYTVESPVFRKPLTPLELAQYGPRFTGVGAQILGADDKYICHYSPESHYFWGSRHELMLGNTFVPNQNFKPPDKEVPPQVFIPSFNLIVNVQIESFGFRRIMHIYLYFSRHDNFVLNFLRCSTVKFTVSYLCMLSLGDSFFFIAINVVSFLELMIIFVN